jgi:hypothetical protein
MSSVSPLGPPENTSPAAGTANQKLARAAIRAAAAMLRIGGLPDAAAVPHAGVNTSGETAPSGPTIPLS